MSDSKVTKAIIYHEHGEIEVEFDSTDVQMSVTVLERDGKVVAIIPFNYVIAEVREDSKVLIVNQDSKALIDALNTPEAEAIIIKHMKKGFSLK